MKRRTERDLSVHDDKNTKLATVPDLPKGIRADTGTGMAHDKTPVWDIVGNTAKVGNIMLVRLDPDATTRSDFQTLARRVEAILEELASVSG